MQQDNPYQAPEAQVLRDQPVSETAVHAPQRVRAGRGASWFTESFGMLASAPLGWFLTLLLFIIVYIGATLPGVLLELQGSSALGNTVGTILGVLVMLPNVLFVGGIMYGAHNSPLRFATVLATMGTKFRPLALLALAIIGASIVFFVFMFGAMFAIFGGLEMFAGDPEALATPDAAIKFALFVLFMLALSIPFMMAIWFAPALVVIGERGPLQALSQSMRACLINFLPFLVFGIVGFLLTIALGLLLVIVIAIIGGIGSLLGSAGTIIVIAVGGLGYVIWIITMIGVMFASQYIGFRDIFID